MFFCKRLKNSYNWVPCTPISLVASLDIYIKLTIAIISFIAPLMLYLLGVFSDGIALVKKRAAEQDTQIKALLVYQVNPAKGTNFDPNIVDKSIKALRLNEETNKTTLNLLNPKRQIKRIYSFFTLALLFVIADMLIKDKYFDVYNHGLSVCLLLLSAGCFVYGLFVLKQIAWAIIETKELIARDEVAESVGTEPVAPN